MRRSSGSRGVSGGGGELGVEIKPGNLGFSADHTRKSLTWKMTFLGALGLEVPLGLVLRGVGVLAGFRV